MAKDYRGYLYAAYKDKLAVEALLPDVETHSEAVAFHSQQLAEKLIKHVFVQNSKMPPKTHLVDELLNEAAENGWVDVSPEAITAASSISIHAVAARYADSLDINKGEALHAVMNANAISAAIEGSGYDVVSIDTTAHACSDEG